MDCLRNLLALLALVGLVLIHRLLWRAEVEESRSKQPDPYKLKIWDWRMVYDETERRWVYEYRYALLPPWVHPLEPGALREATGWSEWSRSKDVEE